MGMLVNIDNGGTLTDICAIKDGAFYKTKTLTTPYDLSNCFFEGLKLISKVIYGEEDVAKLLAEVDRIRYSSTQGTNAICERKGPKLGLIINKGNSDLIAKIRSDDEGLFDVLVGNRVAEIDLDALHAGDESRAVAVISELASMGANRLVVCFDGANTTSSEKQYKKLALNSYPRHLLGAVPMLFANEMVEDSSVIRQAWAALINSFLHPAMETFLFNAENKLRQYRTKNPLLIFRNDGDASRVAKTIAIKTYSSGPRGGMEGVKTFSKQYDLSDVLSMDIGGTTTDIGRVIGQQVTDERKGKVEGISIPFPLCEIASPGAGGSSILSVKDGVIQIGPESVGATPGPACFARGGKQSTMTDVNLLLGLLDPATYFGGGMSLDSERARASIQDNIASALGVTVEEALLKLRDAYEQKIANELNEFTAISDATVLMAFGGAGPMNACGVAEKAGIDLVYVPKTAAVFSAYGIGSCDIGQSYSSLIQDVSLSALKKAYQGLIVRAERDMFAEGYESKDFEVTAQLVVEKESGDLICKIKDPLDIPDEIMGSSLATLELSAKKHLKQETNEKVKVEKLQQANSSATRSICGLDLNWSDIPVYQVETMKIGDYGVGPAVVEEEFFTCLVRDGWEFTISELGDICLNRGNK